MIESNSYKVTYLDKWIKYMIDVLYNNINNIQSYNIKQVKEQVL